MNLREIIEGHIEDKADGLINKDLDCACQRGDLMPCGEPDFEECEAWVNGD